MVLKSILENLGELNEKFNNLNLPDTDKIMAMIDNVNKTVNIADKERKQL